MSRQAPRDIGHLVCCTHDTKSSTYNTCSKWKSCICISNQTNRFRSVCMVLYLIIQHGFLVCMH